MDIRNSACRILGRKLYRARPYALAWLETVAMLALSDCDAAWLLERARVLHG